MASSRKPNIKSLLLKNSIFPFAPSLNGHNSAICLLSSKYIHAVEQLLANDIPFLQLISFQILPRALWNLFYFVILWFKQIKLKSVKFSKSRSAKYSLQHSKMFSPNPLFFPLGHCHSCVDLINIHGDNNQNEMHWPASLMPDYLFCFSLEKM